VTIAPLTRQGHKEDAALEPAAIDLGAEKAHSGIPLDRSTDNAGNIGYRHAHRALRTSARTTSWSENGILLSPMV